MILDKNILCKSLIFYKLTSGYTRNETQYAKFDKAAIEAAKQFEFTPGTVDGKAVKTWMAIPIVFKLY